MLIEGDVYLSKKCDMFYANHYISAFVWFIVVQRISDAANGHTVCNNASLYPLH